MLVLLGIILTACSPVDKSHSAQIFALDTVIDISAYGSECEQAVADAKAEIHRLEKLLSVTDESSDISAINTAGNQGATADEETCALIKSALKYSEQTDGAFDITIYNTLKLWGFTTGEYRVPEESEIKSTLTTTGSTNVGTENNNLVTLKNSAQIDLGGIAKGYIADKAAQAMEKYDISYGIISLGGNVRTVGAKPEGEDFTVGIRHPENNSYFAILNVSDVSVITSGGYQRNFTEGGKTYHHIIDPETGYPSNSDAVSVTIVGKDGAMCDAFSTAVFIGGSEYAKELFDKSGEFEYAVLTTDNRLIVSEGLKGAVELTPDAKDITIEYR